MLTKSNEKRININAGDLKRIISIGTIEKQIVGGLPIGEEFVAKYEKLWAKVSATSQKTQEVILSQGIAVGELKEFVIRYKPDIDNKDVVIYKGKTYNIYAMFPMDEDNEFLLITGIIYK